MTEQIFPDIRTEVQICLSLPAGLSFLTWTLPSSIRREAQGRWCWRRGFFQNPEETEKPRIHILKSSLKNNMKVIVSVWFSRLENAQIIGFKQDIHCFKQPYGPFEPETPNNEKTKEENTPHSQWVFLMETQFWQLYHLLYIIKLKETMNRKGVEERHC